jgi:hypothetical protein
MKRGARNGAWPRNTQHAICQRRVYVLDLETRWYTDCTLESAILYFFHRIHDKGGICVSKKGRGSTVARDRELTIMGQMNAYLLFLETWELKCSGDEVGLRLIAYFHAGRKVRENGQREKCENTPRPHGLPTLSGSYSPAMSED